MISKEDFIRLWLSDLTLADDEMMRVAFRKRELVKLVLDILMKEDIVISEHQTQMDLKQLAGGRSITLDVFAKDSRNRQFDLEIQKYRYSRQRPGFYLASLVSASLKAAEKFDFPETYAIFIEDRKGHDSEPLRTEEWPDEKMHILLFNLNYKGDDPVGRLMHDFREKNPDNMYYKPLADEVRRLKSMKGDESKMSDILEQYLKEYGEKMKDQWKAEGKAEGRAEGRAEGKAEGRTEGRTEGMTQNLLANIHSLMDSLNFSAEEAMNALKVPADQQAQYLKML